MVGILLHGHLLGFQQPIDLLNIYGPYDNRQVFWDPVKSVDLLDLPFLILAGDLNFTWSAEEVWGTGRPCNPRVDYFISLFEDSNLQDISPVVVSPTWYNGRVGSHSISKRLDIYFMAEDLCGALGNYRTWHMSSGILDHRAIIL